MRAEPECNKSRNLAFLLLCRFVNMLYATGKYIKWIIEMVDFSKIRIYKGRQENGFEEFICQLARRDKPTEPSEFRRIEGAGGDGGVEAYWQKKDGSKVGYQAKYFLKSGKIDWAQIDKSVKQALNTHPTLIRYVVALPCDLTDKKGETDEGKTGWWHWQEHKKKWEGWATPKGISIVFEAWTASEIFDRLSKPNAQGLKNFWFDTAEFSEDWYRQHITEAVERLGERYHPEDHVNVTAQAIGHGIVRHRSFVKELFDLRSKVLKIPSAPDLGNDNSVKEAEKHLKKLEKLSKNLADLNFDVSCEVAFPIDDLNKIVKGIREEISHIEDWHWKKRRELSEAHTIPTSLHYFRQNIEKFEDKIRRLSYFIERDQFLADQTKFAIISGAAGTGKSHLSAFLAESAYKDQRPIFLFNGNDFLRGIHAIKKIADIIHKGLPEGEVFGAIDAAGEAAKVRALIIIDAINEGAGSQYWNNELPAFIAALNKYPYIACILTCREEYEAYAVPKTIHDKVIRLRIHGFSTVEEQEEAARVYLDKRGISRPATPWLNPEFINPLFLRSATTALQRDGKTEFPKGLRGTSAIFSYFVEATANNMAGLYPTLSKGLLPRILDSLQKTAKEMLAQQKDRLPFDKAVEIVNNSFENYTAPAGTTWLDVLIRDGLLQCFPIYNPDPDPLQPIEDSVCFAFQRFQDHMMAKQLLENVTDPVLAFKKEGVAAFCIEEMGQWSGLISALSIIIPEKFGNELIDCLPDSKKGWWNYSTAEAFAESVRWRKKDAFTDRTRELLPHLHSTGIDDLSLVLEMSVCEDHPFNAENLLHPIFASLKMPKRDSWWSVALTRADDDHPIYQIVDWSLDGARYVRAGKAHKLAALILAWSFSTTDRIIRDRATKSLVSLIEIDPDIFSLLIDEFGEIDDFYILERIYAAAYGAACRNYDEKWVSSFAKIAFKHVFASGNPPLHLRIRDYARGLVDIAKSQNSLPKGINEKLAYPPYNSSPPKFNLTEDAIKKIAEKAGDNSILDSCTGFIGDFGIYEIDPGTRNFLTVPLTEKMPLTAREKYEKFKQEFIEKNDAYKQAFNEWEDAQRSLLLLPILILSKEKDEADKEAIKKRLEGESLPLIEAAEKKLLSLLLKSEKGRFKEEVKPYYDRSGKDNDPKPFDLIQRKWWVAERAYAYGWTKKLFDREPSRYGNYSRDRPVVERIGKKYQWLALSELQCRLADNYWLQESYMGVSRKYEGPLSIGYERDIDPTILRPEKIEQVQEEDFVGHIMGPEIDLGECEDEDICKWPFLVNPGDNLPSLVYRTAPDAKKFTVLYEHRSTSEKYPNDGDEYRGYKRQEFRFLSAVIVSKTERKQVIDTLKATKNLHFDNWSPIEFTDGPFLLEHPWHFTWKYDEWDKTFFMKEDSPKIARTISRYSWESHLDKAMLEGCTVYMPCPWLCKALGLKKADETATKYLDKNGNISAVCGHSPEGGRFVGIEVEPFEKYLKDNDYECLWIFLSERNTFLDGRLGGGAYRRIEGVAWRHGKGFAKEIWNNDRPG